MKDKQSTQDYPAAFPNFPKQSPPESHSKAILTLLQLFGKSYSRKEYLEAVVQWIRGWSGFRCIGVRVLDEEGYVPYESYQGFSREFWEAENWISTTRDQCICLRVMKGKPEPQDLPGITPRGSFRTNNSLKFISGVPEELQCRFRGVCVQTGFTSLAVIPVRHQGATLAVLHLADEREGRATARTVEFLEMIAPVIGEAVHRFNLEDELRQNHDAEAAINALLRHSLEDVSLDDLLQRTVDLLQGIPWLDFEKGSIRLGSGATKTASEDEDHYWIPIVSAGRQMGAIELRLKQGHRQRQREKRFLAAVANVLAGILMRKQTEEQLLRAQRLEMAGRIASQVAHDFNNLLAPLSGYPQLIKKQLPEDHPAAKYCDALLQSARQMEAINEDLLTLGRRGRAHGEVASLNLIVEQALAQRSEEPAALTICTDLAPDLKQVHGAPAQLLRVISNLISNATDAMEDAGTLSLITENVYLNKPLSRYPRITEGEYVSLRVTDTGCGIPPKILDAVFDPFFSTKRPTSRHGSGLGLSIVQSIVEDYKGYLEVESQVGEGTTFTIYLPAIEAPPSNGEIR